LHPQTILAGWLFRTTRHLALTAIRTEQRRRNRELAAAETDMTPSSSEAWAEVAPLLDEAIARLPETDRNAVLLRYFEGKRLSDVGLELGISVEAAKKRVARAVER